MATSIVATADVTKSVVESLQLNASREAADVDVVAANVTFATASAHLEKMKDVLAKTRPYIK